MTKSKRLNRIEQIMRRIEGSSQSKVELTYDKAIRELEKRKRNKEAEIDKKKTEIADKVADEKERLVDYIEEYNDSFNAMDVEKIRSSDTRKDYVEREFLDNILNKKNKVLIQEQYIDDIKASYKRVIDGLKEDVKAINEFIEKF